MVTSVKKGAHVPDRYNGDLLDGAIYTLNMDYLILNLEGNPLTESTNALKVEMADYGTKVYKERATLTYQKEVFGTIVFKPRSSVIPANLVQLQLENHLFYTKKPKELQKMVSEVVDILGLEYKGINRLDIALDFSGKQHDIPTLLMGIFTEKYLISGREKDFNVYTKTCKGRIEFNGVQIGKRSASRFCRIYNKSKEMLRGDMKPYIKSAWDAVGLDGDVWRYEYQLSNKFMREQQNVSLDVLFSKNFLYNMMQKARANHFEIKENTGKSEVNKERTLNFIDFDVVGRVIGLIKGVIGKVVRTIKETFIGQQRMIKGLLRSYFSSGHDIRFLLPVRRILDDFDLWEWYNTKFSQYIAEFRDRERIKGIDLFRYETDFQLEC